MKVQKVRRCIALSILKLNARLGVGAQGYAPSALARESSSLILAQKAVWVPEPVCTGVEKMISCTTGIEAPDHPAPSE